MEDLIKKMTEISLMTDVEERHRKADSLLCDVLKKHGHIKLVKIYKSFDKWYS